MWEEQAFFGLKTGIALALHLPHRRHFFLGVDRDQRCFAEKAELSQLVADLYLFAVYANEAASRILVSSGEAATGLPPLGPREIECLSWTMEGKTAWEVGAILGLAEATVVSYLRNAMRKLECVNKQQAVARALRFGLIR
jgi:DNA-binding CsgD family transcriptional regulator